MSTARFAAGFGRLPGRSRSFGQPIQTRPQALDRAALPHFWHPDRPGVETAPPEVVSHLARIHPKLRVVRPPANAPIHTGYHPWIVWFHDPNVKHALCPGWLLVFIWENPDTHEPLPLDNRLYANCFLRDPRQFRNGIDYFAGCVKTLEREDAAAKAVTNQETFDRQKGLRDYQKIKNIGSGSKFPLHHDGTNIASRGETNWRTDTLYDRLPEEVRASAEKEGKNTRRRVTAGANPYDASHANWNADMLAQLDTLKLLRDRRERVNARLSRASVGYTGGSR